MSKISRASTYAPHGLFFLALAIRLIFLFQITRTPLYAFCAADGISYHQFAEQIFRGDLFPKGAELFFPLYPYFLALAYKIFEHVFAVGIIQALLDSLSVVWIFLIAKRSGLNTLGGTFGALLYVFYGQAILYTGVFLDATLVNFLSLSFILLLMRAKDRTHWTDHFYCGLTLGFLCLLKSQFILTIFIYLIFQLHGSVTKQKLIAATAFVTELVSILTLSGLRTDHYEGRFNPFPANGGFYFYWANGPEATGSKNFSQGMHAPAMDMISMTQKANESISKNMSIRDASHYWATKAVEHILKKPLDYLRLVIIRMTIFWNAYELSVDVSYDLCKQYLPILRWPFIGFGFLAPLSLLGIVFVALRKQKAMHLILWMFGLILISQIMLFIVTSRYRFAAVPFLCVLAASGICYILECLREKKFWNTLSFLGILGLLSFVTHIPAPVTMGPDHEAAFHVNLAGSYYLQRNRVMAIREYQKALELMPNYGLAYYNLGILYKEDLNWKKAIDSFERCILMNGDAEATYMNLGYCYAQVQDGQKTRGAFMKALELNPSLVEAKKNIRILNQLESNTR